METDKEAKAKDQGSNHFCDIFFQFEKTTGYKLNEHPNLLDAIVDYGLYVAKDDVIKKFRNVLLQ